MTFLRVLPIVGLLLGASASSLDSRQMYAHPLDARDVTNVCGQVGRLIVPDSTGKNVNVGKIDSCLCTNDIPTFLVTNPVAEQGVAIAGSQVVTEVLTQDIVNSAPTNCNYPTNSEPACVNNNPCGFTCTNGYTPFPPTNPTKCVCSSPNVVCNGQCVAAGACPSIHVEKRWLGSGSCTENGPGWAACGVYGGGARAWECVHTARDLESCGGCVLPLTPLSPLGQDCTAIPGVADVSCIFGECVVERCMSGYALSRDGTHCTSTKAHIPHVTMPEDLDEEESEFMQAIRYGLEHLL